MKKNTLRWYRWIAFTFLVTYMPATNSMSPENNHQTNKTSQHLDNNDHQIRYVEFVIVINNDVYASLNNDSMNAYLICSDIVNRMNSIFQPLSVFVALVDVVLWTDQPQLSQNSSAVLNEFLQYRRKYLSVNHPNDYAFLLVEDLKDVGIAGLTRLYSMCSYKNSGGVGFFSNNTKVMAAIISHELAHAIGVNHDTPNCECNSKKCIMSDTLDTNFSENWSSCSVEQLDSAFNRNMDYCLRNERKPLLEQCGNGFVESGEQCDCVSRHTCENSCCNATSCTLYSGAYCASGECCELSSCQVKRKGEICRSASSTCDLPEFCDGESPHCPGNVFKRNFERCNLGKNYCYKGECRSHTAQCKFLWGASSASAKQCYINNLKGTLDGDCGLNIINGTYEKCSEKNIFCGRLQCSIGTDVCLTAKIDMGLENTDPGVTPDGAKCRPHHICIRGKCLSVAVIESKNGVRCNGDCYGHGICDNKGVCHCDAGFSHPFCQSLSEFNATEKGDAQATTVLWRIILPGVIPFILLASLYIYARKYNASDTTSQHCQAAAVIQEEVSL